jgi:hypothetical protein
MAYEFVEIGLRRVQPHVMILILPIRNWHVRGYTVLHRAYLQPNAFFIAGTQEQFNVAAELVIYERTLGNVQLMDNWSSVNDAQLPLSIKDTGLLEPTVTLLIRKVGEYAGRQAYLLNRASATVYYFSANNVQRVFENCLLTDNDIRAGNAPWYRENGHIVCSLDPPTLYRGSNPAAGDPARRRQGTGFLKCSTTEILSSIDFFRRMQSMSDAITHDNLATGSPRSISTAIVARLWCQ